MSGKLDAIGKMKKGTKLITSSNGYKIVVDRSDHERLSIYKWWVDDRGGYPRRVFRSSRFNGKQVSIAMHAYILGKKSGLYVDHKNQNVLDNRRSNLRFCTASENTANAWRVKRSKSGYRGVYLDHGRYRARISIGNKVMQLGQYETAIEAAKAYNMAALKIRGEFACLNVIPKALPTKGEG